MTYLNGLPAAQQRDALHGLNAAERTTITSAVRRGEGSDGTRLAVSIDRLRETSWGRAHGAELRNLEGMHDRGVLSFRESNEWGVSDAGQIRFSAKLQRQPEALSAFMAHEGTHALQPRSMSLMDGELAAHVAQSEVWREVQGSHTATAATGQLDRHLATLNRDSDHLAYQIAFDYLQSPTTSADQRTDINAWCLSHPGVNALMDP